MLPGFLLPETTIREAGAGPEVDLGETRDGLILLLFLGITPYIIEQESLDVSIWGSADNMEWGAKPIVSFPQKFYCGTYQVLLDLRSHPDVRYLRAKYQAQRWGKGEPKPLFGRLYMFFAQGAPPDADHDCLMISYHEALDLFRSDDLIGIGMAADTVRKNYHPEGVVSYIVDRNINYTNFCTEYCSFCAFYRPMGHAEGYVHGHEVIFEKIKETLDLGGTGVLMQGGLHPDLKIEWYEDLLRAIKQRFTIHLHCFSAPEITNIAEVSGLSLRDTIARLRDAGLDSIPGGGAEILDDGVRHRISRLFEVLDHGLDRRASHRACAGHADHRYDDVRLR